MRALSSAVLSGASSKHWISMVDHAVVGVEAARENAARVLLPHLLVERIEALGVRPLLVIDVPTEVVGLD